jgi:hypothetical protein
VPPESVRFSACEVKKITLPSEEIDTAVEVESPRPPFLLTEIVEIRALSSAIVGVIWEKKMMVTKIEVKALRMGWIMDFFDVPELGLVLEKFWGK